MSDHLPAQVADLIGRIPLLRSAGGLRVEPLEGGPSLNNFNWRVSTGGPDGAEYVLRVAADTAASHLGVRRPVELAAARAAAAAGVAPAVLWADEEAGHLLTPFIPGRHWERDDFRDPANLSRLVEALRRLHAVTELGEAGEGGDVYRRIERLLDSAARLGMETPPGMDEHVRRLREIEAERSAARRPPPGLTHQDLWANNFLDDGGRLWLLDWEFAGQGDGVYDLATTAFAGGFGDEDEARLLGEYGMDRPEDRDALHRMKFVVRFFEGAWAMVMHGLRGSAGYDYHGQARRMFDKLAAE